MKKLIWNTIAPILLKLRWQKSNFNIFSHSFKSRSMLVKSIGKTEDRRDKNIKVIIGSIRSLAHSNLFEGALGTYLDNSGIEVKILRCNQFLNKCETKSHFKDNDMFCSMCHKEFSEFKKFTGLEEINYNELLNLELRKKIYNFCNSFDLNGSLVWRGHSLDMEWNSALQRYYLSTEMKKIEKPGIAREFLKTTICSFEAGVELSKRGYTHLITSHGIYSSWGGLVAGFKKMEGDVTVWGRGYYKSGIVSSKKESYLNTLKYFDKKDWVGKARLNDVLEVDKYLAKRWNGSVSDDLVNYYDGVIEGVKSDKRIFNSEKFTIGFYPNIPWDGQTFVASKNYSGIEDVLASLIHYVEIHPEIRVIIRPHPFESPKKNPHLGIRFTDIAEKFNLKHFQQFEIIDYDSTITSYEVCDVCDINVLLAGTIGLEMAYKGAPVIQLGENVSSNKEIFFEPKTEAEFFKLLDKFQENPKDEELLMTEKAKKAKEWAAHYFCRMHVQDYFFNYSGYHLKSIKSPVESKKINDYVSWILRGKGVYFEQ